MSMRTVHAFLIALVMIAGSLACGAQDPPAAAKAKDESKAKPSEGSVTGIVFSADTNLPARMAQVYLAKRSEDATNLEKVATSDLEGRFALLHVPVGTYYVSALLPGYLDRLAHLSPSHLASMKPDERKDFDAHVSTVVVSAKQPAEVSLVLERAAEIDGIVQFDDGSPATGLHVDLKPKTKPESDEGGEWLAASELNSDIETNHRSTDDHGRFRLVGVAPGEYFVSVTVPTISADDVNENRIMRIFQSSPVGGLTVYSGGSLRASKAAVIRVKTGDTNKDANITIPLSALHSIHGTVVLKSTGHPPPAGFVQLLYADTKELARMTYAPNGEFDMRYIPEGSFIVRAAASFESFSNVGAYTDGGGVFASDSDVNVSSSVREATSEMPLTVNGDVTTFTISVPDPPTEEQTAPPAGSQTSDTTGVITF